MKHKTGSRFKRATALSYIDDSGTAPVLSVQGEYALADTIVHYAERYGVPIVENRGLARALAAVQEGAEIPESLYEAVAIVLNELEKSSGAAHTR